MSSRPSVSSKRTSTTAVGSATALPPLKIHSLAVVSDKAQITGNHSVEIGEGTVIHPYARISAEGGSVSIGKNCTIWENARVGTIHGQTIEIHDSVTVETGAVVQASVIGEGSTIGVDARIGLAAKIGSYCKIAPFVEVRPGEQLDDYTVIYGAGCRRIDRTSLENAEVRAAKEKSLIMQMALLKKTIPHAAAKYG